MDFPDVELYRRGILGSRVGQLQPGWVMGHVMHEPVSAVLRLLTRIRPYRLGQMDNVRFEYMRPDLCSW